MKNLIKTYMLFALCFGSLTQLRAQTFFLGEQSRIQPSQVIIDNYTMIPLQKEPGDESGANHFDVNNPYTYLQIIHENTAGNYHILFQTSFMGKILFLSYSNNLSAKFNNPDKPLNAFVRCLKQINNHLSAFQITGAAIDCIMERLRYLDN